MIPDFVDTGGPWEVLPPGIHDASLEEIKDRFVKNTQRQELFEGIVRGCSALKIAGCSTVYLDGSYITDKPVPDDFDICWNPVGVDDSKIDPVLLDFSNNRKDQKLKYGGEFFPSNVYAENTHIFIDYFQIDKYTGKKKGIIRILL